MKLRLSIEMSDGSVICINQVSQKEMEQIYAESGDLFGTPTVFCVESDAYIKMWPRLVVEDLK